MINVQSDVITEYLTDSVNKEITIEHKGVNAYDFNYYTGDITDVNIAHATRTCASGDNTVWVTSYKNPYSIDYKNYIHTPVVNDWDRLYIRFNIEITGTTGNIQPYTTIYVGFRSYYNPDVPSTYNYWVSRYENVDVTNDNCFYIAISREDYEQYIKDAVRTYIYYVCVDGSTVNAGDKIYFAMHSIAMYFANSNDFSEDIPWAVHPDFDTIDPNDFSYHIDNDNLIYEDFTLTESLCSQDNIKFGLCEAAHCEFSEVGVSDIKVGDEIRASIDIPSYPRGEMSDADLWRINWCNTDTADVASTSAGFDPHYDFMFDDSSFANNGASFVGYDETLALRGKRVVMSAKVKVEVSPLSSDPLPANIAVVFATTYQNGRVGGAATLFIPSSEYSDYKEVQYTQTIFLDDITHTDNPYWICTGVRCIGLAFRDANQQIIPAGSQYVQANFYFKEVQYHIEPEDESWSAPAFSADDCLVANGTLDKYIHDIIGGADIPLGVFNVASVSNEYKHNIIRKKITAYDNLLILENNAADWYTRYMFGVDTDGWVSNGFEFARQIFSTYWNYVTSTNLDSRSNYIETEIASYDYLADIKPSHLSNKYLSWTTSDPVTKLRYAEFSVNPDPSKMYMVSFVNSGGGTDEETINLLPSDYFEQVDALGRGVATNGSILVWETRSDGTTAGFCVNKNDYFMISPECTALKIYVVAQSCYSDGTPAFRFLDSLSIYTVETKPELTNGHLRLCYYNYGTKEIFKCESSITGRDVVRSLLEVCGCFFRLDRYKGLPEFVYPTKGGLYPSNTLFPADDLYPRAGTDQLYSMGKYISVIAENYEVKDYGRIQILKKIKSSDTQSVVEWQYEGDPDAENTYIIDDNIFYCAEEMEYDYDGMPEVADMLEGMWLVISNLGYVPNTTQALGAPWLECGDRVGLLTYDGGFETFVFRRTLKGIQNLRDTYESEGDELTPAISNFGYSV